MPYQSRDDLPDAVKKLPPHAQDIYMAAFNSAFKQYDDEGKAHATAWAAVKNKYSKGTDGQWHRKESGMRKLLQDTTPSRVEIIEMKSEADGTVRHRARFLVSRADEVNGNSRLYPLTIWQREASLVNEGQKVVAGQSGHPDGSTDLLRNFLRWDTLELRGQDLLGEADIIPTSQGRDFAEVAKAMPEIISVSTRGMGSGKKEKRGDKDVTVVQDDYELLGIDVIFKGEQSFKDGTMLKFEIQEVPAEPVVEPVAEMDDMHKAAEARAKKYGIGVKEGGHMTPPAGYPEDADAYADPANYRYPLSPKERAVNAITRYNDSSNKSAGGYSDAEWAIIGKRIAAANPGKAYKDGKVVDKDSDALNEPDKTQTETVVTMPSENLLQGTIQGATLVAEPINELVVGQYEKALSLAERNQKKLEEEIAFLEDEKSTLTSELKTAREQLAAESEAHNETKTKLAASDATVETLAEARAVRDHIAKKVQGERFALPLLVALWECETVAQVDGQFPREKARLETELARVPPQLRAVFAPEPGEMHESSEPKPKPWEQDIAPKQRLKG